MSKPRVLVAEDNDATRRAYSTFLTQRGFDVLEAQNGVDAVELAPRAQVVLLDVMMPLMDGWEVARVLNEHHPSKPVLMITALGAPYQKLQGFDLGVDDYLVKPVDLHELEARLRAIMRRSGINTSIVRGDLRIDPASRKVFVRDEEVALSPLEFSLLHKLALHPGKVWSREELLRDVWGSDYLGVDRTVDVRIAGLRRKLRHHTKSSQLIETVRSHGYRFSARSD